MSEMDLEWKHEAVDKKMGYYNIAPSDNPGVANEVLEAVDDLCKELGFVFFLYGGTALGLVRDGAWVEDNDVDITVVTSRVECHALWSRLAALPGWSDAPGLRKGSIQLDLHYTDPTLSYYLIPSWRPRPYTFHKFDTISYRGRNYNVPGPVEKYLDWEFSGLWRTPLPREVWLIMDAWSEWLLLGEKE